MRRRRLRVRLLFAAAVSTIAGAGAALATVGAGCAGVNDVGVVTRCGDFATFRDVSSVLEARCGTLDCHGSMSRPLRIFGRQGLRKPVDFAAGPDNIDMTLLIAEIDAGAAEYYPGGLQGTTPAELAENYRSVCGLEPELTTLVFDGSEEPEVLTLIRKARLVEKHKGGKVFIAAQSDGDKCLTAWLTTPLGEAGAFDPAPCIAEVAKF